MNHIMDLIIEYLILPGVFIVLPRLNQFIIDKVEGKKNQFFDKTWHFKSELNIALFVAYILLVYRLLSTGVPLGLFVLWFIPALQLVIMGRKYIVMSTPNSSISSFEEYAPIIINSACIISLSFYHYWYAHQTVWENVQHYINNDLGKVFIVVLFIIAIILTINAAIKRKSNIQRRNEEVDEILSNTSIEEVISNTPRILAAYTPNDDQWLRLWMKKIEALIEQNLKIEALLEIERLKESSYFKMVSLTKRESVIYCQLNLLQSLNQQKTYNRVFEELDLDSPIRKYLGKIYTN